MHQSKILLADDCRTIRVVVSRYLKAAGFDVTLAENGNEALAAASHEEFALILMDLQMPQCDGHSAETQIRQSDTFNTHTPVIFLTSESTQHLDDIGIRSDSVLSKPVSEEALMKKVHELIPSSNREPAC